MKIEPFQIPGTNVFHMQAGIHTYRIHVYEPLQPPENKNGYPVLYVLDANAVFGSFVEAVRLQSKIKKPLGCEPTMIVGIGYDSDQPFHVEKRFWDYTVKANHSELPQRKNGKAWPKSGGSPHFQKWIETDLKPFLENTYSIDKQKQGLFGHSLGGLFVLNLLLKEQSSFQCHIAGSPSLWWKNKYLLKGKMNRPSAARNLLLTVGEKEPEGMIKNTKCLFSQLKSLETLRVEYYQFPEENHSSVLTPLVSKTLRFFHKEV
ncbi:alpha/beta hydrolase [Salicibibacter cibi]|uniref:Alpha/beta hydrolase n=1 Tax=Salicibibacter cibi TaxID=2743001 RepID=A0A7T6ZDG6_9BACI|nr:alpha/beta hydrolase-fold protein [Salicibibacter cibi]QQK81510.1 alpha/beta hydrolase [Salicibibacter cibi]